MRVNPAYVILNTVWTREYDELTNGQICKFSQQKSSPAETSDIECDQIMTDPFDPLKDDYWVKLTRKQSWNPKYISSVTRMAASICEDPQNTTPLEIKVLQTRNYI